MLDSASLGFGRALTPALLGLDRLYRQESGDEDGLAVVNLDGEGQFPPEPFASYPEARARFAELVAQAEALDQPDRREYYRQTCRSSLAFIEWRTAGLPFAEQLGRFLHVPAEPVPDVAIERLRAEIGTLLDRLGYRGPLEARCAAWEDRHRVPPGDVATTLESLLEEAWNRTERLLVRIPAPRSDGMKVATVTGVPFNARCDYRHRTIDLNIDPVLTRPGLKHLAVHEGYPGHYLQFKLRETGFRAGTAAADVLLSVVNTASSAVFEGIADAGLEMIDWIESDDRIQQRINRYRAAIGTGAAWRLHALGWPAERVGAWLAERALTGGPGWVANRMAFIAAPARAVLIWSYWWGEPTVATAWRRVGSADRGAFLAFLYGRLHSVTSAGMFTSGG